MEEEGFELNYFPVSGYGIPNYYEEVFLTSNKLLEEEPDVVAGFLRASKRGLMILRLIRTAAWLF